MILVDFTQTCMANLFGIAGNDVQNIPIEGFRHIVLNALRSYRVKFPSAKFGKMVLCADGKSPWRTTYFPHYKGKRKSAKTETDDDKEKWSYIYSLIDTLRQEIVTLNIFPLIHIEKAEADDIIAVLARDKSEQHVIVSNDNDFFQCHSDNVCQYTPKDKKILCFKGQQEEIIKEHVIRGDAGDGIPNILSPNDVFVTGGRQKTLGKKIFDDLMSKSLSELYQDTRTASNASRNYNLVCFDVIPLDVVNDIVAASQTASVRINHIDLYTYFLNKKLVQLKDHVQDFFL